MRISGGAARGVPLLVPRGDAVRPATDALRQAVFSSLALRVPGARFLDLFAGSGAYGLEALSRGAAGGLFVERDARAVACLRRNLTAVCKSLGRDEANIGILPRDALTAPFDHAAPPDLIFVDPPYVIFESIAPALFARLALALAARPDALVIFELPGELELAPDGWTPLKRLGKGGRRQPTAAIFRRNET